MYINHVFTGVLRSLKKIIKSTEWIPPQKFRCQNIKPKRYKYVPLVPKRCQKRGCAKVFLLWHLSNFGATLEVKAGTKRDVYILFLSSSVTRPGLS